VLNRDISDLAARSLAATLNERRTAFPRKIQAIQADLAAKGIVGGPTLSLVSDAAQTECEARIDIATAELQRAAESKGVRYRPGLAKDLGDELSELTQNLCQDVEAVGTTALHVIPNAKGGVGMFQSAVQEAVRGRLYNARIDLGITRNWYIRESGNGHGQCG
jgi:hypothetical protein